MSTNEKEAEIGSLLADIVGIAWRSVSTENSWTPERRKAEQMITLLNAGDNAGAEKLAGSWTDTERRAVQAELGRL